MTSLLVMALSGCLWPAASDWTGEWEGFVSPRQDTKDPVEGGAKRVTLEVRADGTAVLTLLSVPCEGRLETGGKSATFLGRTLLGTPLDRHPPATSDPYRTVTVRRTGNDQAEAEVRTGSERVRVTLTRKAQPASGK